MSKGLMFVLGFCMKPLRVPPYGQTKVLIRGLIRFFFFTKVQYSFMLSEKGSSRVLWIDV